VATVLKTPRIILPFGAGAMSAYGLLAAPLAFDFVRTGRQRLDGADWAAVNELFAEMEEEGRALLARAGVAPGKVAVSRIAEMRYLGQGHEVEAAVPLGKLSAVSLAKITASFEASYRALYHRLPQGVPIEALNWRVTVSGPDPKTKLGGHARPDRAGCRAASRGKPVKGTRRAYFAERGGFVVTPVYDRYALTPGMTLKGPAIVEERESTAVIGPGGRARVDAGLALIVETSR
jgi:N-methylhydantoinase A